MVEREHIFIARARRGDKDAWDALIGAALPGLRGVVRRMIGDPDDTDDVVQDALLRAYEKFSGFRGEAAFSTWLISIGTRLALNHLRSRKQWRWDAQVHIGKLLHSTPEGRAALQEILASPEHRFDAREHIAFCFTCVGRSLEPEEQAVLVLRDVVGHTNREAGKMLGISESMTRHRLSAARRNMQERFEGLCGLVSKDGVCYQCEGLRASTPAERRGPPIPDLRAEDEGREGSREDTDDRAYRVRLRVLRDTDLDTGQTQRFHDHVWRAMSRHEDAQPGVGVDGPQ